MALSVSAAVIGVDLGSEFYKSVLIEPGDPFAIVENTQSKRKTNTAVCFTDEERLFEADAYGKSSILPQNTILDSLKYLGRKFPIDQGLNSNTLVEDSRGLVAYKLTTQEEPLLVEEALAMVFAHSKELALIKAKGVVKDMALTVPSYYSIN